MEKKTPQQFFLFNFITFNTFVLIIITMKWKEWISMLMK